jgi:acyl-CoA oxidase
MLQGMGRGTGSTNDDRARHPPARAPAPPARRRELRRELLPLAPLLYLVWADGVLTADEITAVRERITRLGLLAEDRRTALCAWLDPDDPPAAEDLHGLLLLVRAGAAGGPGDAGADLRTLGARIAAAAPAPDADADAAPVDADLERALLQLQAALGVSDAEAARALIGAASAHGRPDPGADVHREPLDAAALNAYIDADHLQLRRRVLRLLGEPEFAYVDTRDTHAYRETVLRWCRDLAQRGYGAMAYPAEFGGEHDVAASIAVFETLAYHDLSLLVKYGVQFGLFAGSIYLLGTRTHHERWLSAAGSLALPGCFAMTETGHGSNVRDLETTATYDAAAAEFIIHTPHAGARKDYIGNAALHGRMAVVFAQLVTDTARHGVHAFVVPIRSDDGTLLPGVAIEDCGLKVGLNGVDNGRIAFDQVRIPRDHLLDRFGSVSAGGSYASPIPSPMRRFFTMLGTLVAGRISIACASLSAGKSGLTIAIRYTARRRQFGPEGEPEVPVLDYTVMQRLLLPRLATAYALDFALKELVRDFARAGTAGAQEIETLAAALKAYASDWTVAALQAAREACGGQGYLAVNRLGRLRADTDVFTTFEGANAVLYQLVAKGRLSEYRDQFGELRVWNIARLIAARAATRVTELNPVITRRSDVEHLLDPAFHAAAFRYREERLLSSLARRLKRRIDNGMDTFHALNECQDHAVELGRACAERFLLEHFQDGVADAPESLRPRLGQLCALYALSRIEAGAAWYLESGYIEPGKSRAIRAQVNELCAAMRPAAEALVDGFGIPAELLGAPTAPPS